MKVAPSTEPVLNAVGHRLGWIAVSHRPGHIQRAVKPYRQQAHAVWLPPARRRAAALCAVPLYSVHGEPVSSDYPNKNLQISSYRSLVPRSMGTPIIKITS
eukprot:COSAG01_NODE_7129_length_3337_cov_9.674799_1_plen_101_part_00